jgi:hypothetical protein
MNLKDSKEMRVNFAQGMFAKKRMAVVGAETRTY